MTIDKETRAEILRLYHVEKWTVDTNTRQLGAHRYTVERLLTAAGEPRDARSPRPSMIDPYVPFIAETLASWPTLPASRLYQMVRERGYPGGGDHFRHLLSHFRPRPVAEAYLRLKTLPGEQAQVDWGHFGKVTIGRAERRLMGFVMVLSYSWRIFLRFYLDAGMSNFLRGHVEAFEAWQGVPRELWYDNLKSVVLERHWPAIQSYLVEQRGLADVLVALCRDLGLLYADRHGNAVFVRRNAAGEALGAEIVPAAAPRRLAPTGAAARDGFWMSWEPDWPNSVILAKSAIDVLSVLSLHLVPAGRKGCAVVSTGGAGVSEDLCSGRFVRH